MKSKMMMLAMSAAFASASMFAYADDYVDGVKHESKAEYKATVKDAKATYKAAKKDCYEREGNEKHTCLKDAKANYVAAKADAKVERKTTNISAKGAEDKMEAEYKADKMRCEALMGDARESCISAAKAKYTH